MNAGLKKLLWTGCALAGLLASSLAHAGGSVYYSVDAAVAPGLNLGVSNVPPPPVYYPQPVYVQQAPMVVVAPRPVYVQPRPVYVQQPAYVVEYESEGRHRHGDREREEHRHRGGERGEHGHHDQDD